jgi:hypothetical protein
LLKRERVYRRHYRTRSEARVDIFDYVERCHIPRMRRRLEMLTRNDISFTVGEKARRSGQ